MSDVKTYHAAFPRVTEAMRHGCACQLCTAVRSAAESIEITIGNERPELTYTMWHDGRTVTVRAGMVGQQGALAVIGAYLVAHGLVSPGD